MDGLGTSLQLCSIAHHVKFISNKPADPGSPGKSPLKWHTCVCEFISNLNTEYSIHTQHPEQKQCPTVAKKEQSDE